MAAPCLCRAWQLGAPIQNPAEALKRAVWALVDDVLYVYRCSELRNDYYLLQCVHGAWALTQVAVMWRKRDASTHQRHRHSCSCFTSQPMSHKHTVTATRQKVDAWPCRACGGHATPLPWSHPALITTQHPTHFGSPLDCRAGGWLHAPATVGAAHPDGPHRAAPRAVGLCQGVPRCVHRPGHPRVSVPAPRRGE